ncbi:MAG: hypothetical protein U0I51_05280 [Muricomes sp.]|jgi:hypothetical protein|uniref:hypothetical protein n=1 Tax=Faecalicatena contorta TaxID=39482 RepID=UPI002EBCEB8A|nr:hypothetical protein [Muricomes sp.]
MSYRNNLQCSQEDYYALVCAVERYMNAVESPEPEIICTILGIEKEEKIDVCWSK